MKEHKGGKYICRETRGMSKRRNKVEEKKKQTEEGAERRSKRRKEHKEEVRGERSRKKK